MHAAPRPALLPLSEALAQLLASVQPLGRSESLATQDADGRVLARAVVSELQVPAHANSAMDGYALRQQDAQAPGTRLAVSQRIPAGSVGSALQPRTAARIFTGAPVPPGADCVLMQEDCALETASDGSASIVVHAVPEPGQWIRRAGEDVQRGAEVLPAGIRLDPARLGLAASVGQAVLQVQQRVRVALFSTGDELVMPGTVAPQDMRAGSIYNSNRFFLSNLLRRLGCLVTDYGIVPDQRDATVAALRDAAQAHDLILTSGGVSVGEEDHVKPAVQQLGALDLWQLAIKPGKPFAHGRIGDAHFVGLPGNPVSSFVTFLVLVRPLLLRLQGVHDVGVRAVSMRADFDWLRPDKRQEFLRVRCNARGGLDLFANQSSGVLTSLVWADGLLDNPAGQAIRAGDSVRYLALADLLS